MLSKIYYWLHKQFSKKEERGEYSAGFWQDAVREHVLEICAQDKGRILEVGCGEGLFLNKIAKAKEDLEIVGLDIWLDILFKAKTRIKQDAVNLIQADAVGIPFKDGVFDRVVCINVFFNLPSEDMVKAALGEVKRVMKKGSRIAFDIRNSRNPLLYFKYKFARFYDETVKDLPLRTYDLNTIFKYLEKNNFKVTRRINIGFPHNILSPIFIIEAQKL